MICADTVRMQILFAIIDVLHGFRSRNERSFDSSSENYLVAPDYRRRVAASRNGSFPFDIFCWTPFRGKILFVGNSLARWAAPLWPVRAAGRACVRVQKCDGCKKC